MFRHILVPVLASAALVPALGWAQTTPPSTGSASPPKVDAKAAQALPKKIHDQLTAQGFKDVEVAPSSFVVNAKDKSGQPVTMLIGPTGMTVITTPKGGSPSIAQSPDQQGVIKE